MYTKSTTTGTPLKTRVFLQHKLQIFMANRPDPAKWYGSDRIRIYSTAGAYRVPGTRERDSTVSDYAEIEHRTGFDPRIQRKKSRTYIDIVLQLLKKLSSLEDCSMNGYRVPYCSAHS
jgi:hypothetical protein